MNIFTFNAFCILTRVRHKNNGKLIKKGIGRTLIGADTSAKNSTLKEMLNKRAQL